MDEILMNVIVIVVLAFAGGLIFLVIRRRRAAAGRELEGKILERGWRMESIREPLVWGLRIAGRDWTLEALSRSSGRDSAPGSSDVSMSTVWRADAPGSTLIIGGRTFQSLPGPRGEALAAKILHAALGEDAAGLAAIDAGSETFRKTHMIRAGSQAEAEAFLTPAVESALLGWKGPPPLIVRDRSGLRVELTGKRLSEAGELFAFIGIGEAILGTRG